MSLSVNAYLDALRRDARPRVSGDRDELYHWAVAAEVVRIAFSAEMHINVVRAVVVEEERHRN